MIRRLMGTWIGILLLFVSGNAADRPGNVEGFQPVAGDIQDLLLLAPEHPVILRLHLQLDGVGFLSSQTALIQKLFDDGDADRDGVWSKPEAQEALKAGRVAKVAENQQFDPGELDKNPTDGQISRDEFEEFARNLLGNPFTLQTEAQSAARGIKLFERLDSNRDGRLSQSELSQASKSLSRLDLDDDELLNPDELAPLRDVQTPVDQAGGSTADLPIIGLNAESLDRAADLLVQRYGEGRAELPLTLFKRPAADFAGFDADKNTQLSRDELKTMLANAPVDLAFVVLMPKAKPGATLLWPLVDKRDWPPGFDGRRFPLKIGGFRAELRVTQKALIESTDARKLYRLNFRRADKDYNKSLSAEESASAELPAPAAKMDRNGDGALTEEEMLQYLDEEAEITKSRVAVSVSHDGKSLFELMDTDLDQRLTLRELGGLAERLAERDNNGDGLLDGSDLAGRYRLTISLDRPQLFKQAAMEMMNRGMAGRGRVPRQTDLSGPTWFIKMDKNRDGDVSWREFPGPREAFDRIDLNHDELITKDEAETTLPKASASSRPAGD